MTKLLLSVLILAGISAYAQEREPTTLLNESAEKIQSFEQIKIDFEYKVINKAQGTNETMDGTLLISGNKYNLDIAGQEIISDGKTIWTFLESVNEVLINEAMNDEQGFNPKSFLQSWSDNFKAKILSKTGNEVLLELLPKEASAFSKVHAVLDNNSKQLISISMFDGSGNEFVYSIKRFITDQSIADKEFTFKPQDHPGIEVIDLR